MDEFEGYLRVELMGLGALVGGKEWGKKGCQLPREGLWEWSCALKCPHRAGTRTMHVRCLGCKIRGIHSQSCVSTCALPLVL